MIHIDSLLDESADNKEYSDQVEWLIHIFEWLRLARDVENHKIQRDRVYSVRFKFLLQLLSRNPTWKHNFVSNLSALLRHMSSVNMFTDVGMSVNTSFVQEFIRRLEDKVLPQSALTENLSSLLLEVFPNEEESILFDCIDAEVFEGLLELFDKDEALIKNFKQNIYLSLYVLSTQLLANAFTVHREIEGTIGESKTWPEAKLQELFSHKTLESVQPLLGELFALIDLCENLRQKNYDLIQVRGIKVEFVFLLESQRRRIERIHALITLLDDTKPRAVSVRLFISNLILNIHHQKSLRSFFTENLNLLTQRIVRRNSDVGEHYVTFNWEEFKKMYRSAVGGGAVTSVTVFIKFLLSSFGMAGFIKGIFDSLNYASSFVCIQSFGWTLATKQPSATAPYLAQSLKQSITESRKAMIAILRTQFIAVLGNLTLVFPICFLVSWTLHYFAHPLMNDEHAIEIFQSSNFFGPTALYAAFTGVLLFLSSLIAGWVDNWFVIHKMSDRISHHQKLLRYLGKERTKKFSEILRKNANPYAASISLGFLLGLAPQYLKFMGLPLEARHITLQTGTFATSLPIVLMQGFEWFDLINALLGLFLIGILNISVSFSLALVLAALSSKVRVSHLWSLVKWGMFLILTKPWLLLVPEERNESSH